MLPLERLIIHQFRGLRDVELPELGRFNVLVGLNNSGKTTVLEAIATYARALRPSEWVDVVRRRDVTSRAALLEGLRWLFPQPDGGEAPSSKPFEGETKLSAEGRFPVREVSARFTEVEGFFDEADEDQPSPFPRSEESGARRGAHPARRDRHGRSSPFPASESGRHSPSSLFSCHRGLRPLPVPEVNSGTFTPGFGAPTPKLLRG